MPHRFIFGYGVISTGDKIETEFKIDPGEIYGTTEIDSEEYEIYPSIENDSPYADVCKCFVGQVLSLMADGTYEIVEGSTSDIAIKMLQIANDKKFGVLKEKFGTLNWILFEVWDA